MAAWWLWQQSATNQCLANRTRANGDCAEWLPWKNFVGEDLADT